MAQSGKGSLHPCRVFSFVAEIGLERRRTSCNCLTKQAPSEQAGYNEAKHEQTSRHRG